MIINSYLAFDGKCKEAFEFYQKVLGGEMRFMMSYGDSPAAEQTPADQKDRIMHARLVVGENVLMGGDAPPQFFSKPQGFSVSISVDSTAEGRRIFDALAVNGSVKMPFGKTFWAEGFGMLIDRFGIPWMVNCETA